MPILIQRMIFDYVPKNAPFWIRPTVRTVFDQLKKLLVEPEIKKNLTMVCWSIFYCWRILILILILIFVPVLDWSASRKIKIYFFRRRRRANCQSSQNWKFSNEQQLTLVILLQSADYQMVFPLEALVKVSPDQVGPKVKEYVQTIHERYVVIKS